MADTEFELQLTDRFTKWYRGLRDFKAVARIDAQLRRLSQGNPGRVEPVGGGVSEMKIDYGPSYRIYFVRHGKITYVVLGGGTKKRQQSDIQSAIDLAKDLKE